MVPASDSHRPFGRTLAWGVILGVGAFALRELVRPRPRIGALVDWEAAERIAVERCREPSDQPPLAEATARYGAMADELRPLLAGFDPAMARQDLPAFQAVGRREWIRVNVGIFRTLFEPLEHVDQVIPGSLLLEVGRVGLSRYLGILLGLLARRVLGQYDPALLGREPVAAGALYLVEPNIQAWQERADLPPDELRRWLALHEMTHAWEFQAHPWLRGHIEALLRSALLGRLSASGRPRGLELLRAFTIGWAQQWDALHKLQAVMSLLEGYSNLIMNHVGRKHLRHFDRLERAYHDRLLHRSPVERILYRVTGLEMKLRQYIEGERFCEALLQAGGMPLLGRVWDGPETLPKLAEIRVPQRWIDRAKGAPGPAAQPSGA